MVFSRKAVIVPAFILLITGLAGASIANDFAGRLNTFQKELRASKEARKQTIAQAQSDKNLSWDEIMKRYIPEFPQFPFEGHRISIDAFCHVDGKSFELRGITKTIEICREEDYDGRECLRSEDVKVSVPRVYRDEVCPDKYRWDDRWEYPCDNPKLIKVTRPLTYEIGVYERGLHESRVELFFKEYTIPACR